MLGVLPRRPPRARRRRRSTRAVVGPASPRRFYLAELVLSPFFGILSDRLGHHRVMLYGPVFGGVAVDPDRAHDQPPRARRDADPRGRLDRRERPVDPRLHRRSRPPGDELAPRQGGGPLRGARRWPGSASASSSAPKLFEVLGPTAFLLNAVLYGVSFLIYLVRRRRTPTASARRSQPPSTSASAGISSSLRPSPRVAPRPDVDRGQRGRSGCGSASRSSSSRRANPRLPGPGADGGLQREPDHAGGHRSSPIVFGAGLLYWGNRFKNLRRTTIILYGVVGGVVLVVAGLVVNHGDRRCPSPCRSASRRSLAAVGLFVLAGATPAALGLLADMSERFPGDRGAIMGLYSVFLALGQITRQPDRRGRRRLARHRRDAARDARPARASR